MLAVLTTPVVRPGSYFDFGDSPPTWGTLIGFAALLTAVDLARACRFEAQQGNEAAGWGWTLVKTLPLSVGLSVGVTLLGLLLGMLSVLGVAAVFALLRGLIVDQPDPLPTARIVISWTGFLFGLGMALLCALTMRRFDA